MGAVDLFCCPFSMLSIRFYRKMNEKKIFEVFFLNMCVMKLSLCSSSKVSHHSLKTISSGNDVSIEQSILNSSYNLHIQIYSVIFHI